MLWPMINLAPSLVSTSTPRPQRTPPRKRKRRNHRAPPGVSQPPKRGSHGAPKTAKLPRPRYLRAAPHKLPPQGPARGAVAIEGPEEDEGGDYPIGYEKSHSKRRESIECEDIMLKTAPCVSDTVSFLNPACPVAVRSLCFLPATF